MLIDESETKLVTSSDTRKFFIFVKKLNYENVQFTLVNYSLV